MEEKMEGVAVETGADVEVKNAEDAVVQAETDEVAKTDAKVGEATPKGEIESILDSTQEKGFFTTLPEEFREEAKKFKSMKEYLASLHTSEPEKTWEDLKKDAGLKEKAELIDFFKDKGLSVKDTESFVKGFDTFKSVINESQKATLDSAMKELWGADYEANKNYMAKGVEVWKNKKFVQQDPSLMYNPIVADLLCEIGRANGAPNLTQKGSIPEEKKANPHDRFGVGIDALI